MNHILKAEQHEAAPRPMIGLLTSSVMGFWKWPWLGVVDAARAHNADVVCFSGSVLNTTQFNYQRNVLFKLVKLKRLCGLVIWSSALDGFIGGEGMQRFCEQYHPLPVVSVERTLRGIPSLLMDDYAGMYAAMSHFIKEHGYRRIAFISGARNHAGAQERQRAYVAALADHGLPFDPKLVVPPTSFWDDDESKAVFTRWLDTGKPSFEALMGVNDAYTMNALAVLAARGVRTPEDVAAAGFDAQPETASLIVPLTTVRPPFYELGWRAAEMILEMAAGQQVADTITLPTQLVIRQSCGCFTSSAMRAVTANFDPPAEPATAPDGAARVPVGVLQAGLAKLINQNELAITAANADELLQDALFDATKQSDGRFLRTLNRLLRQADLEGSLTGWSRTLATLRQHMLARLGDAQLLRSVEDLWQQGQILVAETEQRAEMRQGWQDQQQAIAFRRLGQSLITTFDINELLQVIAHELPRLGIKRCYLAMYENPQAPTEQARLLLAYDEHGQAELPPGGLLFPSQELLPAELWRPELSYNLIVEALFFKEQQLGFVVFEAYSREDWVYETLRGELSSSLKGALLVEQEERRAQVLRTVADIGTEIATILDERMLLQSTAELTRTHLGIQHVNVYLLDEQGETLALAASAGQPSTPAPPQGYAVPIQVKRSLVAHAARSRGPVSDNNLQSEAELLAALFLPGARSAVALPLLMGDELLGVLELIAEEPGRFPAVDQSIQTTFVRQIAGALQNARLYRALEQQTQAAEQAKATAEEANSFKSRFLASMSHELRTPLNAILNFTRFMGKERYGTLTTRQVDLQQRILTNAEHLLGLIKDILDLSKIEAGHMELFLEAAELEPLIRDVMATATGLTKEKGLALRLECAEAIPVLWIDKTRIRQVLLNLLSNSAKFTEQGEIVLGVSVQEDHLEIMVRDTGIGIAPEHQALIFEEFRQVQGGLTRKYQGTGLGLSISKQLVALHGGQMWLESAPGQGSRFYFTLPISAPTASEPIVTS